MDNLENILNITNYREHPTRNGYTVFHFFDKKQAEDFEKLLKDKNIWYETDSDQKNGKTIYFFGIRNSDRETVVKLNYLIIGKYRQPFIPNAFLRWSVIFFGIFLVVLAIVGYFKTH